MVRTMQARSLRQVTSLILLSTLLLQAIPGCGGGTRRGAEEAASSRKDPDSGGTDATPGSVPPPKPVPNLSDPGRAVEAPAWPPLSTPESVIQAVGNNVTSLFRFVSAMGYESYAGALRGPTATLHSHAGNSVDRSLLLAELLKKAGHDVRFVGGRLEENLAESLLAAMSTFVGPGPPRSPSVKSLGEEPLKPPDIEVVDRYVRRMRDFRERVEKDTAATVDLLTRAIADAKLIVPDHVLPSRDSLISEAREHVWVQYRRGSTWLDLDPTMPHAAVGDSFADAAWASERLPTDLYHRVRFRIEAEYLSGSKLSRSTVLEYGDTTTRLAGERIHLVWVKPEDIEGLGRAIDQTITGRVAYTPVLIVGSKAVKGEPVMINETSGIVGVLSNLFPGADDAPRAEGVAAISLVVELLSPRVPVRRFERLLFDRIGASTTRTAGGSPRLSPPAVAAVGDAGRRFLPLTASVSLSIVTGLGSRDYVVQRFGVDDPLADQSVLNYGYHFFADRLQNEIAQRYGLRFYHPQASVTATSIVFEKHATGVTPAWKFDVIHRSPRAIRINSSVGVVHAGILNAAVTHAVERNYLTAATGVGHSGEGEAVILSTGDVIRHAQLSGTQLILLRPEDSEQIATLGVPTEVKARLAKLLADGNAVLVPREPVPLRDVAISAWWRIDLDSGTVRDELQTGGGEGIVEFTVNLFISVGNFYRALWVGLKIKECLVWISKTVGLLICIYNAKQLGSFSQQELEYVIVECITIFIGSGGIHNAVSCVGKFKTDFKPIPFR